MKLDVALLIRVDSRCGAGVVGEVHKLLVRITVMSGGWTRVIFSCLWP